MFSSQLASWPRLSRASTSFWPSFSKQDVDGRDKPGHDDDVVRYSQPEHVQYQRVALLLELRRVDESSLRDRARPRHDRHVLLAFDLERHRRRGKARAHVDLPQLIERGVVIGRNRAVQ